MLSWEGEMFIYWFYAQTSITIKLVIETLRVVVAFILG